MAHPEQTKTEVLRALRAAPYSVQAVAASYGVHHSTVTRWARAAGIELPSAEERIVAGGITGTLRLWGNYAARRKRARKMRAAGKTLEEIAAAVGYRSVSGASYAARSLRPPELGADRQSK